MDKLDRIFKAQRKLMTKYGISKRSFRNNVKSMALAIISEVCEIIDEKAGGICVKDWRKRILQYDRKYVKKELADLLHFYVELCILLGVDSNELFEAYLSKNKINKKRINSGYERFKNIA